MAAADNKDRFTRRHSQDVMAHGLLIARALGLGEQEQQTVAMSALLHDVGKIGDRGAGRNPAPAGEADGRLRMRNERETLFTDTATETLCRSVTRLLAKVGTDGRITDA